MPERFGENQRSPILSRLSLDNTGPFLTEIDSPEHIDSGAESCRGTSLLYLSPP